MKMKIWALGDKHSAMVKAGVEDFSQRLGYYFPCSWQVLGSVKHAASLSAEQLRNRESELLLLKIPPKEWIVLLDERGKLLDSPGLAEMLRTKMVAGTQVLNLVIGGAYGVNTAFREQADFVWSLSPLVFPHQLVRLMLVEQLYRAATIIHGGKYHHM